MLPLIKRVVLGIGVAAAASAFVAAQSPRPDSDQPASGAPVLEAIGGDLWFVELASGPTTDGTSLATVQGEKAAFRRAAAADRLRFEERRSFDVLFNGLSVRIDPSDVGKLRRVDGVRAIYPVTTIAAPPEPQPGPAPELKTALAMTGADIVQSSLGYTGASIKVGVIDTGIDYDHPDLGGCFGVGCRVATGFDFVGDAYDGSNTPTPDANPDDCNGHGTHVAGIIGADGGVTGVAPGVTFGAYRVFGCAGSTQDDVMISAMERALADGMNVVNMSIGASSAWPEWPTAQASTRLVNEGVVVVASAGNDGSIGLYGSSAPATGSKVISVASFDNTSVNQTAFSVSPDDRLVGYNAATGAPAPPLAGTFPLARTGTTTSAADACAALPAGSLAGRIVLIRRGTCGFNAKAFNAESAGAAGVILYNNAAGALNPTVAGPPTITIPVVAVTAADGSLINSRIAADPTTTMTWTSSVVSTPNPTGGLISSFSSYGVSPDLVIKPDLGAPGGSIRSTFPLEQGAYATLSGTSMSSPHVAGAVALLLQAHPRTSPQQVRNILQNSAEPRLWRGNPALGFLDNVHRQGAGLLKIDRAILATTAVTPGKLSLGESEFGPVTQRLAIANSGTDAVTYDLSHGAALATGPNTFAPSVVNAPATVSFSATSITVPAGGVGLVDVTVTPNSALADRSLYGGYIVVTPEGGGQPVQVPFAGFKGDYQSIQVLAPTPAGYPWLAKTVGTTFANQPAGATFTFVGTDVPNILLHLDHQARRLRFDVIDAITGRAWHRAVDDQYDPRNSSATGFFTVPWDGVTVAGKRQYTVPNGQYVIVVSVLKALGDDTNPAHWETWTSPVITIARP
jgi:minor extracellular serine protease Vpr